MMRPERHAGRKLLRSWFFQNLSFGSLGEAVARIAVEAGAVLLAGVLVPSAIGVASAWLIAHSVLWVLVYGGYSRIRVVLGMSAPLPRLRAYLERLRVEVARMTDFRIGLLRGSAARSQLTETSDIDVLFVPRDSPVAKVHGVLVLWRLRIESVIARVPLQARWLDREVFVSLNVVGERPLPLVPMPPRSDGRTRLDRRGILVAVSGKDPGLRAAVARGVADALGRQGHAAICLPGIPQTGTTRVRSGNWGRVLGSLGGCVGVARWRTETAPALAPGKTVILDGFLPDLWASLETDASVPGPLRTLMVGLALEPDASFLLEATGMPDAGGAGESSGTHSPPRRGLTWYGSLLGMTTIDASGSVDDTARRLVAVMSSQLGLP